VVPFTVHAVLVNCALQENLELAPGVAALAVPEPIGFRGELEHVLAIAEGLGADANEQFRRGLAEPLGRTEPVAVIRFETVTAEEPVEAEAAVLPRIDSACDTLAILTANSSIPIAFVMNDGPDRWFARMLPPAEPTIFYPGPASFLDVAPRIYAKALSSPAFNLLCRLFRIALQTRQPDARIFHLVQVLELASQDFPGTLDMRIRRLFEGIQLHPSLGLDSLSNEAETCWAIMRFRHIIAHSGVLTPVSADGPQDVKFHPLLVDIDGLGRTLRELVKFVLASLATRTQ
jgi:hypothetical protein